MRPFICRNKTCCLTYRLSSFREVCMGHLSSVKTEIVIDCPITRRKSSTGSSRVCHGVINIERNHRACVIVKKRHWTIVNRCLVGELCIVKAACLLYVIGKIQRTVAGTVGDEVNNVFNLRSLCLKLCHIRNIRYFDSRIRCCNSLRCSKSYHRHACYKHTDNHQTG